MVLNPSYSQCSLLSLIPALALHCVVLISREWNKDVCPRKALPCLCMTPAPATSCSFPVGCYYQQSLDGSTAIQLSVLWTHTLLLAPYLLRSCTVPLHPISVQWVVPACTWQVSATRLDSLYRLWVRPKRSHGLSPPPPVLPSAMGLDNCGAG